MASNSVNILLKARDEASPAINKASKSTDNLKTSMRQTSSAGSGLGGSMKGMVGPLALVAGGFLAAKAASAAAKAAFNAFTSMIGESLNSWAVQEEAMRGNSKELQNYAANLQALTNIGDEEIMNQMQVARGMGVTDDRMKQVTQSAIALAEITGKPLKRAMRAAVNGTEGYVDALIETFPAMRQMETESEKQAFIQQKLAEGWDMANQGTNTLQGALKSLGNNWGDMLEKVGELLAPFVKKLADWFNRISPIIQEVIAKALPLMQSFAEKMGELAAWIGEKLVYAWTFAEVAVENWVQVMFIAIATVKASIISYVEMVKHRFTVEIPAWLKWFADNFLNMGRDMFMAYITMWKNRIAQIIDLIKVFWDVVTRKMSGGDAMRKAGEIAGRNMLEGFKITTEKFPGLIEREMSGAEKAAWAAVGKTTGNLLDKVNDKFEGRMASWKDLFTVELGGGAGKWMGLDLSNLAGDDDPNKKPDPTKTTVDKKQDFKALTASEGRLLSRGRVTESQKQLKAAEDSKKLLETLNELMEQGLGFWEKMTQKEQPIENNI
tara:strand:- start:1670 stop:3322 length:1653 start_codon:yes stop_codon:yes gene_type:complete